MPYCTPDDVRNSFPRVLTTNLQPMEIDFLCQKWSDYIDGWIASRFTVPVAGPPSFLRVLAMELVWLDLIDRGPGAAPDFIVRRHQQIDQVLTRLSTGQITIPGVAERTDIGTIHSNTEGYVPPFGAVPTIAEQWDPLRARDEAAARDPRGTALPDPGEDF